MLNVELEMLFEGAFGFIISTQSRNRSAELLRSRPEAPCRFNTSTLDLPNIRFLFVSAFSGVSSNCRPFHADWWFCNVGPWCGKFSSNFTEVEMFVVKGGKNDVDPRSSTGNKAFGDGNVIGIGNGVAIGMATDVDTDAPRCDSLNGDNSVGIPVPNPLVPTGMGELIAKGDGKLNTVDAAEAPLQIEVAVVGTCTCSCLRNVCAMDMFICSEVAVSWTWHCLVFSLSFAAWRQRRRYVEYQWFLIALSVLPGSNFAISAQRLPSRSCAARMSCVSSARHGALSMLGSKKLSHRVRHCLGVRPGSNAAILAQRLVPHSRTKRRITASSSGVHARRLSVPLLGQRIGESVTDESDEFESETCIFLIL